MTKKTISKLVPRLIVHPILFLISIIIFVATANADTSIEGGNIETSGNLNVSGISSLIGNVGIGVTNPSAKLDIRGNLRTYGSAANAVIKSSVVDGAIRSIFMVGPNNSSQKYGKIAMEGTSHPITFWVGNPATEKMRINSSGNVGIGTTDPSSELEIRNSTTNSQPFIQVINDAIIGWLGVDGSDGDKIKIGHGNPPNQGGGTTMLTINPSTNKIGIGTTNPTRNLQIVSSGDNIVQSESTGTDSTAYYILKNDARQWSLKVDGTNDSFFIRDDNASGGGISERLSINTYGNIGIGNSNPQQKLNIVNYPESYNSDAQASIKIEDADDSIGMKIGVDDGNDIGYIQAYNEGTTYNKNLILQAQGGNVGIRTTSVNNALDVDGNINATGCFKTDNTSSIGGTCLSDIRFKQDIVSLNNSLDKVVKLNPVSYSWKENTPEQGNAVGLIAQEVEEVFPELIKADDNGYKNIKYDTELTMHLIQSIKELKAEVDTLKSDLLAIKQSANASCWR